jgi:hypothetical protein
MWNGNAAILKPRPPSASSMPSSIIGWLVSSARATPRTSVVPATPYMNESP